MKEQIKKAIGWGLEWTRIGAEELLGIEHPLSANLKSYAEENERLRSSLERTKDVLSKISDSATATQKELSAENERLAAKNRELWEEQRRLLNQAKPDSIKNTVPVAILRAVASVAHESPDSPMFVNVSNGTVKFTAKDMLEECRQNTDAAKLFCDAVIEFAVDRVMYKESLRTKIEGMISKDLPLMTNGTNFKE